MSRHHSADVSFVIDPLHSQLARLRPLVPSELFAMMMHRFGSDTSEGQRCDLLIVPNPQLVDEEIGAVFSRLLEALGQGYGDRFSVDLSPMFDVRAAFQSQLGDRPYTVLTVGGLRLSGSASRDMLSRIDPDPLPRSSHAGIGGQSFQPDAYTVGVLLLTNPKLVTELPDWFTVSGRDLVFQTEGDGPKEERRLQFLQTTSSWVDEPLLHIELSLSRPH